MRRAAHLGGALCLLLAGCNPDLGECDMSTVRTVVYDTCGRPAYLGQAQMQSSCGYGSFCHAEAAVGRDRYGAPAGLNWDVGLAGGAETDDEALATLHRGRRMIFANRDLIWTMVETETMPPGGEAGEEVGGFRARPRFHRPDGTPLLGLDQDRERDELRNWLACGLPVVERTDHRIDRMANTEGDVYPAHALEESCTPRPEASWASIYDVLIEPWCGSSCHNPRSGFLERNMLDLGDIDRAYTNLVNVPGAGLGRDGAAACNVSGLDRVEPGNPNDSLLYIKLIQGPMTPGACGSRMPLGGPLFGPETTSPVRDWIMAGAPR